MNLNKVFILGNLTRDPDRRSLPSGKPVVSFGVATNRFFTPQGGERQQETEFHNVTLFGRLAEIASQYLQKGSLVLIEGRLRTRSWQDSAGTKRSRTEIIADNLQLGPKRGMTARTIKVEGSKFSKEDVSQVNVSDEDIPIIEEESTPEPESRPKENPKEKEPPQADNPGLNPKSEEEKEIDVSKIPF